MNTSLARVGATLLVMTASIVARAEESEGDRRSPKGAESAAASRAVPFMESSANDGRRAAVSAMTHYDNGRRRTFSEAGAEVRLFAAGYLQGGATSGIGDHAVAPFIGGRFLALSESRHFVDGGISAIYRSEGFNLVPALEVQAALARHFGPSAVYLNAGYGHGVERAERYGQLRLAMTHGLLDNRLFIGVASRVRVDLERDDDEPANEVEMDAMAGPLVGFAMGGVALSGFGGWSAARFRDRSPDRAGLFGGIGIGTVFF